MLLLYYNKYSMKGGKNKMTNEENKQKISEKDRILIAKAKKDSLALPDRSAHYVVGAMEKNSKLFSAYKGNGILANIGCGDCGDHNSKKVIQINQGIQKCYLVDPYIEENQFHEFNPDTMEFHKQDGLEFLLGQKAKGKQMSVQTSSIDCYVIGDYKYLERMAEVIHDVVPEEGFYVTSNSIELEEVASKLFPIHLALGTSVHLFTKRKPEGKLGALVEFMQIEERYKNPDNTSKDLIGNVELTYHMNFGKVDEPIGMRALLQSYNSAKWLADVYLKGNEKRLQEWRDEYNPIKILEKVDCTIERLTPKERKGEVYEATLNIRDFIARNTQYFMEPLEKEVLE